MDRDVFTRKPGAQAASPFLNNEQAAAYLGLSPRYLRQLRREKTGPRFRRHCHYVRYHIDDLDAWSNSVAVGADD